MYEITERLTHTELIKGLSELKERYGKKFYKHRNGGLYYVVNSTVVNGEGGALWGLIYSPVDNLTGVIIREIQHTRNLKEFTDGRFKELK